MFGFHHATEVRIGASSDETAALGTDNLDEEPRKVGQPNKRRRRRGARLVVQGGHGHVPSTRPRSGPRQPVRAEWNTVGRGRREKGSESWASLSKLPRCLVPSDIAVLATVASPANTDYLPTQCDGAAATRIDCPAGCSSPSRVSKFPPCPLTPDRASPSASTKHKEQKGSTALVSTWCLFLVHHHNPHAHPRGPAPLA